MHSVPQSGLTVLAVAGQLERGVRPRRVRRRRRSKKVVDRLMKCSYRKQQNARISASPSTLSDTPYSLSCRSTAFQDLEHSSSRQDTVQTRAGTLLAPVIDVPSRPIVFLRERH
jgi:hypothetical protein